MNAKDFEKMVAAGLVGRIIFQRCESLKVPAWYVFTEDIEHSSVCQNFGLELRNNDGEKKSYTSLDRAWVAIRRMGFKGDILIDG